jgi:hypothetical protein
MDERPVVRGCIWQGISRKRNCLRCNTTSASISGYSSGKLLLKTCSALRFTPTKPEVGSCTLSQDGAQHHAEEAYAQSADRAGAPAVSVHEARSDHHLAARRAQGFEDARDIARVMLPVSIHPDDVSYPNSKASL